MYCSGLDAAGSAPDAAGSTAVDAAADFLDLASPPEREPRRRSTAAAGGTRKEEIIPSYDFQPIRTVRSSPPSGHDMYRGSTESNPASSSLKRKLKVEESRAGSDTRMIVSLRESLQSCEDELAVCQSDLDAAKSKIQKWHSAFQNGPTTPAGIPPEPEVMVTYLQNLKSSEESLKEQLEKAKKREAAFIVTFAKRDQEIADLKSAVRDLKTQLRPPSVQTRRLILDPSIHEEFTRLKNLVDEKEKKLKELQEKVANTNFTTSSKMGKMLTAKCRTLQEENEEIGAMASEGKIHELAMKIAVLKSQNAELRNHYDALWKHMEGLAIDVDRSNERAYILQTMLEAKNEEVRKLKELIAQKEEDEYDDDTDMVYESNHVDASVVSEANPVDANMACEPKPALVEADV